MKAGALLYAVALSLFVAIISSSFVLYFQFVFQERNVQVKKLQSLLDCNSAMTFILSDNNLLELGINTIDLFGDNEVKVNIEKKNWGLYHVLIIEPLNFKHRASALVGNHYNLENRAAIRLNNNNSPLYLAGKTKITGDCYLPNGELKRANVDRFHFDGDKLISGSVFKSGKNDFFSHKDALQRVTDHAGLNDSLIGPENMNKGIMIYNSFYEKALSISSNSSILLDNDSIIGNVIISSKEYIRITNRAFLKDVILLAPNIYIEDGFIGQMQCIAFDSIVVSQNCELNYPSILFASKGIISVGKNSRIEGEIIAINYSDVAENKLRIRIDKDVSIVGLIETSGNVILMGSIAGGVIANSFTIQAPSYQYTNYLYNAVIDAELMPIDFACNSILDLGAGNQIIKWLE